MAPALAPIQIGQELAVCALIGGVLGGVRALFPEKGRGAILPDIFLVGALLFGLQSYTAAYSAGGVFRWYMPGIAALSAATAEGFLRLPGRILRHYCKKSLKKPKKELAK